MVLFQLLTGLTVVLTVAFHLGVLHAMSWLAPRLSAFRHLRVGVLVLLAIAGHLIEIGIFAGAMFGFARTGSFGRITGSEPWFQNYYYYSAVTYTSLGYGDLLPVGGLRALAGIEALTGMILIAWTSSYLFLTMQRYWEQGHRH